MIPNSTKTKTENILVLWNDFIDVFLINKQSYLVDYPNQLLTQERINNVLKYFNDDTSDRLYEEKLKDQFANASYEEKLIYTHAEWVYLLIPIHSIEEKKLPKLNRWHDIDEKYVLEGIVSSGSRLNNPYWHIRFILSLFNESLKYTDSNWIEPFCKRYESLPNNYAICSIIKFFVNPDYFEQIISHTDKKQIARHYRHLINSNASLDEQLYLIRKRLDETKAHGFHFYDEELIREWKTEIKFKDWLKSQKNQQGNPIKISELIKVIDRFYIDGKVDSPIFTVVDTTTINDLYDKCLDTSELYVWNQSVGAGGASAALNWYLKFLRRDESISVIKDNEELNIKDRNKTYGSIMINYPKNQILYGAAGTGKTYNTVNHALAIIEGRRVEGYHTTDKQKRLEYQQLFNEYKKDGRIEFVTFHQNFAYEDFIEGIKPIVDNKSDDSLRYEIAKGIFKTVATKAKNSNITINSIEGLNDNPTVWKASLGEGGTLIQDCFEKEVVVINSMGNNTPCRSFEKMESGDLVAVYQNASGENAGKLIRGIGVIISEEVLEYDTNVKPKYYRKVKWLNKDTLNVYELNNHKRMTLASYYKTKIDPIKLLALAGLANKKEKENYVLIIDEINRGNIAKIFGELITLIEPSKREGQLDSITVTLPYSQDEFSVPDNLYIIGTMNTSDRSIALLDTALRRRFEFIEMMPDASLLKNEKFKDVDLVELLTVMNNRIRVLLDREHQIGHTYFFNIDSLDKLKTVFQNQIMPLLQEYFYNDWAQINKVLNDNGFVTDLMNDKKWTPFFRQWLKKYFGQVYAALGSVKLA